MRSAFFAVGLLFLPLTVAADWLQFRGPGGAGIAPDNKTPVTWSSDDNIAWKTAIPGPGASSPIVVGDKVFITYYSGYGVDRDEPGDQKDLKRHLLCVDRKIGKVLWDRDVKALLPEAEYKSNHLYHGYASSTPVSDGKHVWVFYGKTGVFCYDLDGKLIWSENVGTDAYSWGAGVSPILYKDKLIINASTESGALFALDKTTGKEVWKTKDISESWSTPTVVKLPNGSVELVLSASMQVLGFDPDTGKELWHADSFDWYVCPSVIAHDGIVYALQNSTVVAIKAGGRGDVTKSHTLWQKKFGAIVTSAVYHDGHVYWADTDRAYCLKASDGSQVYREELKHGGRFYASPLLADGKLYYVSRGEGTYVLEVGTKFKVLARNVFKDDTSIFNASPAISDSQLFLRSERFLYC